MATSKKLLIISFVLIGLIIGTVGVLAMVDNVVKLNEQDADDYSSMYSFRLEINGATQAGIQTVSGMESEIEVIEYRYKDDIVVRKRPGRIKYSNIVLNRKFIINPTNDTLWQWYKVS